MLARVFADRRRHRHAARHEHARQPPKPGQRHHHRRQPLVAGGHAEHAAGIGIDRVEPAEDRRRVVAIGQTVVHARRALRATVARIATVPGIRHPTLAANHFGGGLNGQSDLPVSGVISQGDRRAVVGAEAAQCAQQNVLPAAHIGRVPAHAGVLRHAESIAAGPLAEDRIAQRQLAFRAWAVHCHFVKGGVAGIEQRGGVGKRLVGFHKQVLKQCNVPILPRVLMRFLS